MHSKLPRASRGNSGEGLKGECAEGVSALRGNTLRNPYLKEKRIKQRTSRPHFINAYSFGYSQAFANFSIPRTP